EVLWVRPNSHRKSRPNIHALVVGLRRHRLVSINPPAGSRSDCRFHHAGVKVSVLSIDNSRWGSSLPQHGTQMTLGVSWGNLSSDEPRRPPRTHLPRRLRPSTISGNAR